MQYVKGYRRLFIVGLLGSLVVLLGACGPAEDETLQEQLTAQEQKAAALEQQLAAKEAELADVRQTLATQEVEVPQHQDQLIALEEEAAELRERLGELADMTVILGALPLPTPEPRPTPTPLPEGVEPPPRPEPPAEYYEPVGEFAFYVETLTASGVTEYGYGYTLGCALSNVFKRGTKMVWRVEVIDLATGMRIMPEDGTSLNVVLPHGEERSMRFSQRGGGRVPDAPWMWATSWEIPSDYPVGTLDFSVVVTAEDDRTGLFKMPYSGVQVEIID